MYKLVSGVAAVLSVLGFVAFVHAVEDNGTPLFDGKTFNGWEGNLTAFRIEDGAIVGGSLKQEVERNEFLCTTKEYGDFELRITFKLLGEGVNAGSNSAQNAPDHHEVSGYQADMGEGYWGALYDESRRNKILAAPEKEETVAKIAKLNDWNEYVIRAEGKHIQQWLNGTKTVDYTETDDTVAATGVIALQIHGGPPSEAWYKNIVIEIKR